MNLLPLFLDPLSFIKMCQNTSQLYWGDEWSTLSPGDCVVIGEMVKNVMLNLFQHLMELISYETLKRVQGDKK
jgi:hypothetical protein